MAQAWKTVRIFISSTFRDMHAERDHLVRFVFPELRERCAKRQLHLVDVDLRWGVTEEEAERKVLEICLDEIERCRPFFIGLLGERYGWVPPKYDVPDEKHYNWVREFEPGHSITAMEIYHGVLCNPDMKMRAFFYFRDPTFLLKVPDAHWEVFQPESKESAEKLKRLKDDVRKNYPVFDYSCAFGGIGEDGKVKPTGLDAFGEQVLEDLWSAIEMEYPVPVPELHPDELAIERAYHDEFIEGRCQRFIGRRDLIEQMTAYADGENNVPLVITGTPGCGKSALMANFARAYATIHSDVLVLPHFIGVSPGSTDIRRTLLRLCRELAQRFGIADEIPEDYEKLRGVFTKFLEQAASQGKVLLILDALNQVDESYHAHTLSWLPYTLPKNLRCIVSTLEGDCLEALHRRRPAPPEIMVGPLELEDQKQIIRKTLWDYRKRLDEIPEKDQMGLLLSKGESDNPLYLIVACEELRVFGEFERVTERIKSLPGDVPVLFEQVLERLERDHGKELIKSALSLLECSRHGLLETEMLELLRREGEEQLPRAIWARLYRSLQFYLRPPGERGEGALDFFHRQLAKAVRERYLKHEEEEIVGHRRLAEYFRCKADPTGDAMWKGEYYRAFSELPYHLLHAQMRTELEKTLSDLRFVGTKCSIGMVDELLGDYEASRMPPGMTWDENTPMADFGRFISHKVHLLRAFPSLLYQEAFNSLSQYHVHAAAENLVHDGGFPCSPWLRKIVGAARQRHSGQVISLAFLKGDRYLAVSTTEREVWVWDTTRDELWLRCETPPSVAKSLVVSPNGKFLAAGFGADVPDPFISGVVIWTLDGKVHRQFSVIDWVYTLRWRDDTRLIVGAGMPMGSEAAGRVCEANLDTETCMDVGIPFAERPVVLTWDPVPASFDQIMALSKDGQLHHLIYGSSTKHTRVPELFPPCTGMFGYYRAADDLGSNTICLLGHDGIYVFDFSQGKSLRLPFGEAAVPMGVKPICLATAVKERCAAVGMSDGKVWMLSLQEGVMSECIHKGSLSVTSVCFSELGTHIAFGDKIGQIYVYRRSDKSIVFRAEHTQSPVAVRFRDSQILLLYLDRLEVAALDSPNRRTLITWADELSALDFDLHGDLAVILCGPSLMAKRTDVGPHIQIVDLAAQRVVLSMDIPECVPAILEAKILEPTQGFAKALMELKTLEVPLPFYRIRLQWHDDSCSVILGSAQGIGIYPLLAFDRGHPLVLPKSIAGRQRTITVMRLGKDVPEISCNTFEIVQHGAAIICGYSDNMDWPHVSGEIRIWDLDSGECSIAQYLGTSVHSIASSDAQTMIVGTVEGEASSWRFDGEWHRLAGVRHPVAVVSVACTEDGQMACSASRDGLLIVWDVVHGHAFLRTFIDAEPVGVGFLHKGRSLCMVDSSGEVHIWEIFDSNRSSAHLPIIEACKRQEDSANRSLGFVQHYLDFAVLLERVQTAINRGDFDDAKLLLAKLPEVHAAEKIKRDWQERITNAQCREKLPRRTKELLATLKAIDPRFETAKRGDCLAALQTEFKHLLECGRIADAHALALALPASSNALINIRRSWLEVVAKAWSTQTMPKETEMSDESRQTTSIQKSEETAANKTGKIENQVNKPWWKFWCRN